MAPDRHDCTCQGPEVIGGFLMCMRNKKEAMGAASARQQMSLQLRGLCLPPWRASTGKFSKSEALVLTNRHVEGTALSR